VLVAQIETNHQGFCFPVACSKCSKLASASYNRYHVALSPAVIPFRFSFLFYLPCS
jgi:hypothetical protein